MIYWEEYKQLKKIAELAIKEGTSVFPLVYSEVLDYQQKKIDYDNCIENIVDVLSNGEHKKPNKQLFQPKLL